MRQRPLEYYYHRSPREPERHWLFRGNAVTALLSLAGGVGLLLWAAQFQRHASPLSLLVVLPVGVLSLCFVARALIYFLVPPLLWGVTFLLRKLQPPKADYPCPVCGYDTRFTPNRCPECGTALHWGLWVRPEKR